jgi:hypothetical protein
MAGLFGGASSQKPTRYLDYDLQTSALGVCIPLLWGKNRVGDNVIQLEDFQAHAQGGGKGGGKGGGGKGATSYDYTVAFILALCEGPVQDITAVWASSATPVTLASLNLSLYIGTNFQTPPAWIISNFPARARSYAETAFVFSPLYDLGSSASIPSHNFDLVGNLSGTMPPFVDANMADIIPDFITSAQYGLDPSATYIDATSLAFYKTYCTAQALLFSPYLRTQEQATSIIQRWAQLSNTWIFWNGVALKFVPLGDAALTAYGVTYTPVLSVRYALTPDDFVPPQRGGDLVTVTRIDPADGYNRVEIDARDRNNNYQTTPVYWEDQASVDANGQLQSQTISADEVCDQNIASIIATLIGKRSVYIRNKYEWTTGYTYILLEPGDIVTLTDPGIGLNATPVRVTEVAEDATGNLKFTAEEFPGAIGQPVVYATQANTGSPPADLGVDPGDVNPPVFFEPDPRVTGGIPQLWIGASGGPDWGGAQVYVSVDGTNYVWLGTISTPTVQGTLTAILASHADPDTVDTLAIDVTESGGVLSTAVTTADADAARTASLVDAEIVSFGTVTSTGAFDYDLTYLRRGVYNTTIAAHSIGAPFARIDPSAVFVHTLPQQYVGVTLYFKLPSFNKFGNAQESIADATAYTYVPTGVAYTIAAPTGIALAASRVTQADGTTVLTMTATWTASVGPNLASYEVQFSADSGATWPIDRTVGASALSNALAPALASTSYQARVRAISQNGLAISAWDTSSVVNSGALVAAVPSAPTGLSALALPAAAALSWTASGDLTIRSYQVWRAPGLGASFGSAAQIGTTGAPSTNYTDNSDAASTSYTYFLIAVNAAGSSTASTGANVTTLAAASTGLSRISGIFTANGTLGTIPADAMIIAVTLEETAGHAVSISLGTASGGAQVLTAAPVGANGIVPVPAESLLLQAFTASQSIFVASGSWGSASVTVTLWYVS